jgi:hypothetical protein
MTIGAKRYRGQLDDLALWTSANTRQNIQYRHTYSSLLVLVNEAQRRQLRWPNRKRSSAEYEPVGDPSCQPASASWSSEPQEWLYIPSCHHAGLLRL